MKDKERGKLHRRTEMVFLGLALMLLGGCGTNEQRITETVIDTVDSRLSSDRGITIYTVKDRSVVAEKELFQPKQPDSVANALEETMGILPLTDGVSFQGYTMGNGNAVSLAILVTDSVSREALLLEKAAIVSTIEQIRNIGPITLSIRNEAGEVTDEAVYSSKSFYYYDDVIPTGQNTGQIELYLPDDKRETLNPVSLMVTLQLDSSVEEEVVKQLIERGALPEKTQLISLSVTQRVAYVDLSPEFLNGADEISVYALVNSICNLPHVSSVQILIDGEKKDTIGSVDTHVPLSYTVR